MPMNGVSGYEHAFPSADAKGKACSVVLGAQLETASGCVPIVSSHACHGEAVEAKAFSHSDAGEGVKNVVPFREAVKEVFRVGTVKDGDCALDGSIVLVVEGPFRCLLFGVDGGLKRDRYVGSGGCHGRSSFLFVSFRFVSFSLFVRVVFT